MLLLVPHRHGPENGDAVAAGGEGRPAVGAERDACHFVRMGGEREDFLAGLSIPQFGKVILAAGEDALAVGADGDARDTGRVAR